MMTGSHRPLGARRRLNFDNLNSENNTNTYTSANETVQAFMTEMTRLMNNPDLIRMPPTPLSYDLHRINIEFNVDVSNNDNTSNNDTNNEESENEVEEETEDELDDDELDNDEITYDDNDEYYEDDGYDSL